tara:strand:- start:186 stop:647 length:462 start_codon:yes stop_codon:yes gene_type:complete
MIPVKKNILQIDEELPRRVFNTSLIVAAIVLLISISNWSLETTLGLSVGMGTSIIFFMLLCGSVKSLAIIEKNIRIPFFIIVATLKFTVLSIALFLVFKHLSVSYLALLIGIGLAQSIIFLKLTGMGMVNYMNRTNQSDNKEISNARLQMTNK